jgi:hypothetical protein
MARLHWAECHSECFRIRKWRDFRNCPNFSLNVFITECFPFDFRIFSVWFPKGFRIHQMVSEYTEYFPHTFRTRRIDLECNTTRSETILEGLWLFVIHAAAYMRNNGKDTEPSTSQCSFRMPQELDVCFPNVYRTRRMFLECFPNTSRIHMQATFGRSMKIILNMRNKFLELPNAVPYGTHLAYSETILRTFGKANGKHYGPFTLGRMPFRMFYEYEFWCSGS